jgi:hypothetical protein
MEKRSRHYVDTFNISSWVLGSARAWAFDIHKSERPLFADVCITLEAFGRMCLLISRSNILLESTTLRSLAVLQLPNFALSNITCQKKKH